jgi:arginyl-tRNA synthetase
MHIRSLLETHVKAAMTRAGLPDELHPHLAPSKNAKFGDYQANGAMAAAKAVKQKPRDVAEAICKELDLSGIANNIEIAGPGFINIHLDANWLAQQLTLVSNDDRLGIERNDAASTVVIDYSSPNLAKEMHVGHLRSTIIGDAIARVLEFNGDHVIRQNHVGDWGTQFGMLIAELEDKIGGGDSAEIALKDLEQFYQASKKRFDDDEAFADRARNYVVRLQSGEQDILKLWEQFRQVSLSHSDDIYRTLNVTLEAANVRGESAYNDELAPIVDELKSNALAVEDDGALVVFLQELADKEGNPSPVIIQKKDGGYLYATTDLAAIRYRADKLQAKRLLYFIDDRQSLHMKQVFTIARKANFISDDVRTEHCAFGKMLGKDGKPFKTRAGGTVKLADLLEEATERAAAVVKEKNPGLSEDEIKIVSNKVGIGAVKYADLSKTRTNDYIFDWEAMLSFEGNTGPYLQYAYTRIASIFRKADIDMSSFSETISIGEPKERELALKLMKFSEVVDQVVEDAMPHVLCTYLYDLASLFMSFYETCPILKDGVDKATKNSRLQISKACALTLKQGLNMLGIDVMEKM